MDPRTKEFKKLQAEWYAKLGKDGFEDIEQDEEHLKIWHSCFFAVNFDKNRFEAKSEYYRLAGQFLHAYKFKSKEERFIWEQHTNGVSLRMIAKFLKRKGYKTHKDKVNKQVNALVQLMVEQWTQENQD